MTYLLRWLTVNISLLQASHVLSNRSNGAPGRGQHGSLLIIWPSLFPPCSRPQALGLPPRAWHQAPPPCSTRRGAYSHGRGERLWCLASVIGFLREWKGFESSKVSLKVHKWVQNGRTKCTKHLGHKTFPFSGWNRQNCYLGEIRIYLI